MSYATLSDVQALNAKRTYGASTTPTSTQVEGFITDCAAELDTILSSRGVTVPVTAPAEFLAHLGQVNALGAAALAEMAMFPEAQGMGATPQGQRYWKMYTDAKEALRTQPIPSASSTGTPMGFFEQHEGEDEEPERDYTWQESKFKKNKEF